MGEVLLNPDTLALLKECDSGCKMGTESMEQIMGFVNNSDLAATIMKYNEDHIKLGEEIHEILNSAGEQSAEPNLMAKASSWIQSQIKMMINGDAHQAASILIDGCNMGIKSLNEYKNKYKDADDKTVRICDKLIKTEQDFMDALQAFL